jgi:hypothetical protein
VLILQVVILRDFDRLRLLENDARRVTCWGLAPLRGGDLKFITYYNIWVLFVKRLTVNGLVCVG